MSRPSWFKRVLLALDQLGNVLLFRGSEDETISSNSAKAARRGEWWGRAMCWALDKVDPGHCERAIEHDEGDPVPPAKAKV